MVNIHFSPYILMFLLKLSFYCTSFIPICFPFFFERERERESKASTLEST